MNEDEESLVSSQDRMENNRNQIGRNIRRWVDEQQSGQTNNQKYNINSFRDFVLYLPIYI